MAQNRLKFIKITLFILILFLASACLSLSGIDIFLSKDTVALTEYDLGRATPNPPLTMEVEDDSISYKLGGIEIRNVNMKMVEPKQVYLGGKPLGISMGVNGLIVSDKMDVVTKTGMASPLADCDVRKGDILTHIDGVKVNSATDISEIMKKSKDSVILSLVRGDVELHFSVKPAIDAISGAKKLGLWLRNDVEGIGTLTYIDPQTNRYGALGHVIKDGESGMVFSNPKGNIYNSYIHGVVKGQKGKAGELSGNFVKDEGIGTLDVNCDFGVFGNYSGDYSNMEKITLGSKYSVRPGKAHIYSTLDGETPERYEIEIIKNSMQTTAKTKGLLIRVTDKRLLEKSGGIVQGMSGSPIIQNGKLIGAVTHVFVGDPTKGYGTYIDWMLPN